MVKIMPGSRDGPVPALKGGKRDFPPFLKGDQGGLRVSLMHMPLHPSPVPLPRGFVVVSLMHMPLHPRRNRHIGRLCIIHFFLIRMGHLGVPFFQS